MSPGRSVVSHMKPSTEQDHRCPCCPRSLHSNSGAMLRHTWLPSSNIQVHVGIWPIFLNRLGSVLRKLLFNIIVNYEKQRLFSYYHFSAYEYQISPSFGCLILDKQGYSLWICKFLCSVPASWTSLVAQSYTTGPCSICLIEMSETPGTKRISLPNSTGIIINSNNNSK